MRNCNALWEGCVVFHSPVLVEAHPVELISLLLDAHLALQLGKSKQYHPPVIVSKEERESRDASVKLNNLQNE